MSYLFPSTGYIRIKTGESIFGVTTRNKADLYLDDKNIKGFKLVIQPNYMWFKIGISFVIDIDGMEIDLVAAELAKEDDEPKTVDDEGKLIHEGKDVVDNYLLATNKNHKEFKAWLLQITGPSCIMSTMSIPTNGLYTCIRQHSFTLPTTAQELSSMDITIEDEERDGRQCRYIGVCAQKKFRTLDTLSHTSPLPPLPATINWPP